MTSPNVEIEGLSCGLRGDWNAKKQEISRVAFKSFNYMNYRGLLTIRFSSGFAFIPDGVLLPSVIESG